MNNEEKILEILQQMQGDISGLKQDMAGVKQDIAGLKQDMVGVKQDIAGMKQDMAGMKQDIAGLKQDMVGVKQDMAGMKQDIASLRAEMAEGFRATRSEIVDVVEGVGRKVDSLESTIRTVQDVTAQNAFDVQLMRRRA